MLKRLLFSERASLFLPLRSRRKSQHFPLKGDENTIRHPHPCFLANASRSFSTGEVTIVSVRMTHKPRAMVTIVIMKGCSRPESGRDLCSVSKRCRLGRILQRILLHADGQAS